MSYSDYLENKLLDYVFGVSAFTPSGTLHLGLSSGNPGENMQTLVEPSIGGYVRAAITNDKSNWSSTSSPTSSGTIHNVVPITFPTSTDGWGLVTHFGIFDQSTGGHMYAYGSLTTSRTVLTGDTPIFSSGNLVITMD